MSFNESAKSSNMKFLLIIGLLVVAIAACDAWTVHDVKEKIDGITDISHIDFTLPGDSVWRFVYRSTNHLLGVPGTIVLNDYHLLDVNDIQVIGDITQISENKFEIPLHTIYKYDVGYTIRLPGLVSNQGRARGKNNVFCPVTVVKITDTGVFELVDVKSVTLRSDPIEFSHSEYTQLEDVVFKVLESTVRPLIEDEVGKIYPEFVSSTVLSHVS